MSEKTEGPLRSAKFFFNRGLFKDFWSKKHRKSRILPTYLPLWTNPVLDIREIYQFDAPLECTKIFLIQSDSVHKSGSYNKKTTIWEFLQKSFSDP